MIYPSAHHQQGTWHLAMINWSVAPKPSDVVLCKYCHTIVPQMTAKLKSYCNGYCSKAHAHSIERPIKNGTLLPRGRRAGRPSPYAEARA